MVEDSSFTNYGEQSFPSAERRFKDIQLILNKQVIKITKVMYSIQLTQANSHITKSPLLTRAIPPNLRPLWLPFEEQVVEST